MSVFAGRKKRGLESKLPQGFRFGLVHGALVGLEETVQLTNSRRVPHLTQGLCLDLANSFAGDLELLPDFFERAAVSVLESKAEGKNLSLIHI